MAQERPHDPFSPHTSSGDSSPAEPEDTGDGLHDMTVAELKKLAKSLDVAVTEDGKPLNKGELIDAIRAHRAEQNGDSDAPPYSPDPSVGTGGDAQSEQGEPAGTDEHGGPAVDEDTVNDWSDDESASLGD